MRTNLPLIELSGINVKDVRRLAYPADDSYKVLANVIYHFLLIKGNLADVPILSSTDIDLIIYNRCVS